jgi:hypothetical protein
LSALAREFFLREVAIQRSDAFAPAQLTSIRVYQKAATERLRAAKDLRGVGRGSSTLALFQQAAHLLALSFLASKGQDVAPSSLSLEEAFERLDAILAAEGPAPPAELSAARALLLTPQVLALDLLPPAQADRKTDELQTLVEWLAGLVDVRSQRELKTQRLLRTGLAGVAVVGALVWAGIKIFSPPNLALHRPVTSVASSYGTTASAAVDGDRSTSYGFHSVEDDAPWLSIDLGQRILIDKVKVFGRSDCCFDQSIPLVLEISDDGVTYKEVATRTENFSDYNPWIVPCQKAGARYIRLRVQRRSYLVVNEVEVYGKKSG